MLSHQLHPDRVVTFSVVYRPTMPTYRVSARPYRQHIRAVGVFSVTRRNDDDVELERYQYAYPNKHGSDPLEDMLLHVDHRTHCLAFLPLPPFRYVAAFGPPDLEELERHALPIHDAGRHRSSHFLRTNARTIQNIAHQNEISLGKHTSSMTVDAAHCAQRAQAIWLSWTTLSLARDPDQKSLLAAHQVWHKIERLRGMCR